ncbi:histidine kinase [Pedobacter sp. KR3-3]|uniref:Histidine kinase n=1 Tax=Pedobacter albus TaxID=3113905 RepID=A0ABU7I912_9SPHI|nr:histidine kinase [Pedobacter sp. KR3-3]MEE1945699.1 histidine kinase [Pedobacter sp. KR3-3]
MKYKWLWLCLGFFLFYNFQEITWAIGNYITNKTPILEFIFGRRFISYPFYFFTWLCCTLISYSTFYVFFYQRHKKVLAIAFYICIAIPLMICIRYFLQEVVYFSITGKHNYSADMRAPIRYFIDNIYFTIYYSLFGIVFFFIQLSTYNQKKQHELLLQNRQSELSFLRSQINPHFLFNSLNNVYTLVYQGSDKALGSISKLSELLRYMLYEKEEWVPLLKEVQYLRNFIDLQLMRYDFKPAYQVKINIPADCTLKIAPLTLIPFVENAFKHGDLRDTAMPLQIELELAGQALNFKVSNKKGNFNKDETGGIGLENVKKRLDLIYASHQTLHIADSPTQYTIVLQMKLHE